MKVKPFASLYRHAKKALADIFIELSIRETWKKE